MTTANFLGKDGGGGKHELPLLQIIRVLLQNGPDFAIPRPLPLPRPKRTPSPCVGGGGATFPTFCAPASDPKRRHHGSPVCPGVPLLVAQGADCAAVMTAAAAQGMTGAKWTWLVAAGCTGLPTGRPQRGPAALLRHVRRTWRPLHGPLNIRSLHPIRSTLVLLMRPFLNLLTTTPNWLLPPGTCRPSRFRYWLYSHWVYRGAMVKAIFSV